MRPALTLCAGVAAALFLSAMRSEDATPTNATRFAPLFTYVERGSVKTIVPPTARLHAVDRRASLFAEHAAVASANAQRLLAALHGSLPCPRIDKVNGQAPGVVTLYPGIVLTITGCGFSAPRVRSASAYDVYFYASDVPRTKLTVSAWTDTKVTAQVDPALVGVLDAFGTATLGVGSLEVNGISFRANDQMYRVTGIPASAVTLSAATPSDNTFTLCFLSCVPNTYYHPWGPVGYDWPQPEWVAEVKRMQADPFSVGNDVYDFSGLSPSFSVDANAVPEIVPSQFTKEGCWQSGALSLAQNGTYGAIWDGTKFTVSVGEESCWSDDPTFMQVGHSDYMVQAWVDGPRGLTNPQPWQ